MNRQTKRLLQRQGQLAPDGTPQAGAAAQSRARTSRRPPPEQRASVGRRLVQYLREVRGELAKVLWPRRPEVVNYSSVVLTTLVFLALLIFALNYVFAKGVMFLFKS